MKATSESMISLNMTTPAAFARSLIKSNKPARKQVCVAASNSDVMDGYDMETVRAIRDADVGKLREMLDLGKCFEAANRNGETLLHLACRRGDHATVMFLVHEAGVATESRDNFGRTVLHDICWRPNPSFELMEAMIYVVPPSLLITEDSRGHTCFDYCRKEHTAEWVEFLRQHSAVIKERSALEEAITAFEQ